MNKSESKYFNTAKLMDQAFLSILEKKAYDYITVKEVCIKAGVNRSTFYLHYESMDDLLCESIEYITKSLFDEYEEGLLNLKNIQSYSLDDLFFITPRFLCPYLEFIKKNQKVFLVAFSSMVLYKITHHFEKLYQEVFEPILNCFNISEDKKKYMLSFFVYGLHAIVIKWVQNDCVESAQEIANIMISCVNAPTFK